MTGVWIVLGAIVVFVLAIISYKIHERNRRSKLRQIPLSDEDIAMIESRFPIWKGLPQHTRREASGWVQVFLYEKNFEACGGLSELTREMMLLVAAPACLLIAHRPQDYYKRLRSILLYPTAYHGGDDDFRLGESWSTGSVVLSWESVKSGSKNDEDGHNVVLHEFAHQLDQEDGAADGVPALGSRVEYGRWSRAFAPAYEAFCERVNAGKKTVLDDYGATNPAEFFAVATETFFEKPRQMKREEPHVYEELERFYGMDPESWL